MGTNFYYDTSLFGYERPRRLHIGKRSYGFAFCFAPYHDLGLSSWRDWLLFLKATHQTDPPIVDEYGNVFSLADMVTLVERLSGGETMVGQVRGDYLDPEGHWFASDPDFS